jgi:sugar phosphate isomerase/epimerase
MSTRLLSLAAGVLPDFGPTAMVAAAVAAGWPAVGIWVEPVTWTATIAAEIRDRAHDADAGAAIGARNVLIVSSDPDPAATAAKFARLAAHAAQSGLRASLEFALFTEVRSIAAACAILDATGRADVGLLVDPLHLARCGDTPQALRSIDPARFAYAQFCDAPVAGPAPHDIPAIIHEALDLRLEVGQGALPLAALLDALPADLPLSVELRSKALRDAYPDATARAAALLASTRRGLASISEKAAA